VIALLLAAAIWPPWQTVAQGASLEARDFGHKAFVAGTLSATRAFTPYLRDEDKGAVTRVNFTQVVVVAALTTSPTPCYRIEIVDLRRRRRTLTVTAVLHPPPPRIGCIFAVGRPYHVISVARRVVGTPLPRRVVLREQPPAPSP